jgi:hypothetical protein
MEGLRKTFNLELQSMDWICEYNAFSTETAETTKRC